MKIGLVVEGGGMKCAYNAGILDMFLDDNINFSYCIGVSGGAGNISSYLSKQRGRNLRFFTTHCHTPKYIGFRSYLKTGNIFGLEYIYHDLIKHDGPDPIDFKAMLDNPTQFEIVATEADSGKAVYFQKEDMAQDDYRVIMASCAIPAACKPVIIDDIAYYDGGVSDAIPVRRALESCDKVVVILSKPRDYVRSKQKARFFYKSRCKKYPNIIKALDNRHIDYNKNLADVFKLEEEGKAFVFAPSEKIKVSTYTVDDEIELSLYNLGIKDYKELKDKLIKFMNSNE